MNITKKLLCLFMVILTVFGSVPINVFAEKSATETVNDTDMVAENEGEVSEDEAPAYEIGNQYTIDGIVYEIKKDGTVVAKGTTEDVPKKVEFLDYLGEYAVTQIQIYGLSQAEEIIVPETVRKIQMIKLDSLEKIEVKGEYVEVFTDLKHSPYGKNKDNWKDGCLIVGSCLVSCELEGVVEIGEEITSISNDCFGYDSKVTKVKIYNSDCVIPNMTGIFPSECIISSFDGSKAERYATAFKFTHEKLCVCEKTETVDATKSYCDGTLGYTKGEWCEKCQVWQSGHEKVLEMRHIDEDENGTCDFCENKVGETYIDSGLVLSKSRHCFFWGLNEEGTLYIFGKGDFNPDYDEKNPWEKYSDNGTIKKVVISKGIESVKGNFLDNCENLETVIFSDTVKSVSGVFKNCTSLTSIEFGENLITLGDYSFRNCTALQSVKIPENVETIGESAFRNCTALADIKIESKIAQIGYYAFCGTSAYKNPDNVKNGILYIDGYAFRIIDEVPTKLIFGPEIKGFAKSGIVKTAVIEEITIYNPNCVMLLNDNFFKSGVKIKGIIDSTAQEFAKKRGFTFIPICVCDETVFVEESNGYCDGTIGYTAGYWCDKCQIWASGHEKKNEYFHLDFDEDDICDYCEQLVDVKILDNGKCGEDMCWYLTDDGRLLIVGEGDMYSYTAKNDADSWRKYADTDKIKSVEISKKVTSIGDYAFYNMSSITEVRVSPILLTIGEGAFKNCTQLEKIDIPDTVYTISESAFENCRSLKAIHIPSDLSICGNRVFAFCESLQTVDFQPNKAISISDYMFYCCTNLEEVKNSGVITSVGNYAFSGCVSLTSFDTGNLRAVGISAFRDCKSLTSFDAKRVTSMGKSAFEGCEKLETFVFSNGVTDIPSSVLKNCKSVTSITLGSKVEKIGSYSFAGCSSLGSIELPQTLKTIGNGAFENCSSLESIVIPENAKEICSYAFFGCDKLETITIKGMKTYISGTFTDNNVNKTTIPVSATIKAEIGSTADIYADEYNLKFEPITEKEISSVSFVKLPSKTIYVLGEDTEFCIDGAIITVTYTDGTEVNLKNRYTVDWSACNLQKVGAYSAKVIFGDYSQEFEINVVESQRYEGIPESRTFNLYCKEGEWASLCFIPDETGEYTFCFDNGNSIEVKDNLNTYIYRFGTIKYIKREYEKGKEYYFFVKSSKNSQNLRITEVDDIYFSLRSDGTYEAKYCFAKGNVTVPAEFGGIAVTKIADSFVYKARYSETRNITVSEGIKEIGKEAFRDFKYNVTIPQSVEKIGDYAFAGTEMTDIVINKNVNQIGKYAFYDCEYLKNVTILPKNIAYDSHVFASCSNLETVSFADGTETLGKYMFNYCENLKTVSGLDKMTVIPDGLFYNCSSLEADNFVSAARKIGAYSFYGCDSLKTVETNSELTEIPEYAFYRCTGIEKVILSDNISKIGKFAFSNCNKIREITLPPKIGTISLACFSYCKSLESVNALGKITKVDESAFYYCEKLTEVSFFEDLEYIEFASFKSCTSLKESIYLKNALEISSYAFDSCAGLKEVVFDKEVNVKTCSFANCTSLEKVKFNSDAHLSTAVFDGCSKLKALHFKEVYFSGDSDFGTTSNYLTIYGNSGGQIEKAAKDAGYQFVSNGNHKHALTETVKLPTSCRGYTTIVYTCDCGYSYTERDESSYQRHVYKDIVIDKNPTCTDPGVKSRHCYCGKSRSDISVIEPLGHKEVIDIPAVSPTADKPGYTHQSHCSVCGEIVIKRERIDPLDYKIEIDGDMVTAQRFYAATNESDGEYVEITFSTRDNVCVSLIDKTVIYKVGEVKLSKTRFTYNGKTQKPTVSVKDSEGNKLKLNKDYKVSYSKESKYSGKYSVKIDYIGNYAGGKTLYYNIIINSITPNVKTRTTDSVELSWKTGNKDLTYRVYSVDKNGNMNKLGDTKKSSFVISSLKSGSEYLYCVRAFVKDENSKFYWGEKGATVVGTTRPKTVTKVSATEGANSIKLSWNKSQGATGYRIYRFDESKNTYVKVKDVTSLSYTVRELKSGTKYKFAVKAYTKTSDKKTVWAEAYKSITTATKPAKTKLSVRSENGKAHLSWKNISGESGYQIYYSTKKDGSFKLLETTDANEVRFSKALTEGKTYYFKVRAYKRADNKTLYASFSDIKSVKIK